MFNEATRADNSTMLGNDTVYFRWVGLSKKMIAVTLYDSKGIVYATCTFTSADGKYFMPYLAGGIVNGGIRPGKDSNARHWGPKQNETYTRLHDKLAQEITQWLQVNGFTSIDGYLFEYDGLTPEERIKRLVQELQLDAPAQEPAPESEPAQVSACRCFNPNPLTCNQLKLGYTDCAPCACPCHTSGDRPQESEPAQELASDLTQELAPASIQGYSVMLLVGAYIVKRIGADTQALAQEIASVNLGVWLLMPYVQKNTLYQVDRVMVEDSGNCIIFEKSLKDLGKRPGAPRPAFTPAQEPAPAQVIAQEPAPALPSHTAQVIARDLAQVIAPTYDKNRAYTQALSLALAPAQDCSYPGCTFPASIRIMFTSGMRACYCNTHGAIFDTDIIEESESLDNAITRAVQATLDALKQK